MAKKKIVRTRYPLEDNIKRALFIRPGTGGGGEPGILEIPYATRAETDAGTLTDKVVNPDTGGYAYDRFRYPGRHAAGKGTKSVSLTANTGVFTIDCLKSNVFELVLTDDGMSIANPVNPIPGQTINIHVRQPAEPAVGGNQATFGTQWTFANKIDPVFTAEANATDLLSCQWDSSAGKMRCTLIPNFGSGYVPPPDYTLGDFSFVNLGGGNEMVIGPDAYLPEVYFRTIVGAGDIEVTTVGDTIVISYTATVETPSLFDLLDTDLDNVQVDDSIKWDGTNWVRRPPDEIPDLSVYSFVTFDDHFDPLASSLRLAAGENVSFTVVDNVLTISAATEPGAVPQNKQNGDYTLVATDSGAHIYKDGGGAATWTIPSNASVAFGLGTVLTFVNDDAEDVTIAIDTDTLVLSPGGTTGSRTLGQYGMATAIKVNTTRWIISGTELT